jgi:coatomer subunit beta
VGRKSPDMDVRRKAISIALDMVSSRNAEDVVLFLRKELLKTLDGQFEKVIFALCLSSHSTGS